MMSAEQVAVATCPHSFAVGICKNGFSEPLLQNAGIIHCVFFNKYHDTCWKGARFLWRNRKNPCT